MAGNSGCGGSSFPPFLSAETNLATATSAIATEGNRSRGEGATISHFCLASSQSTRGRGLPRSHPDKDVSGFFASPFSVVYKDVLGVWCVRVVLCAPPRQLASIPRRRCVACWHCVGTSLVGACICNCKGPRLGQGSSVGRGRLFSKLVSVAAVSE